MAEKGESAKKATKKGSVRIVIFDHDNEPQVEPGHAVVDQGRTIAWQNLTSDPVLLVLPDGKLFAPPTSEVTVKAGEEVSLKVRPKAPKGGHKYIAVRRQKTGVMQLVRGGSNPVIIIR